MSEDRREEILELYDDDDRELVKLIIRSKTKTVTRVQEIIEFAEAAGYERIGIAYCRGMAEEAEELEEMLSKHFTVVAADCKVFGLRDDDFVEFEPGPACNPVGQAKILGDGRTQLNIALGLCLGHDMLFQKHSEAPVTVLGVKDRVQGNDALRCLRDD